MADSQNKQTDKAVAEAKQQDITPKPDDSPDKGAPSRSGPDKSGAADRDQGKSAKQSSGPKKSLLVLLTLFLLIILALATAGGGYYLWQQQQLMALQQHSELNRIQQQLQPLQAESTANQQYMRANNAMIKQLESNQQQISDIAQRAIDQSNRGERDWVLAEIDYLLRLASRRLQIARDINSAVAALQAADQRIHDLGDLSLLPVRKQLAKDIAALKALHQVDVDGTALALDQMIDHLGELPFKSVEEEVKAQVQDDSAKAAEEKPQGFIDSVISTVKNIGDIKVHQRSIEPASSAQQQQQIEQILRTHLLSARLAVLRYDQSQFAHDLQQAQQILHLHYQQADNRVAQMQTDLAKFSSINLQPELPVITTAWTMLHDMSKAAQSKANKKPAKEKSRPESGSNKPAEVL